MNDPYSRADLALVHHRGFGFPAGLCAPGILELLEPVRARNGLVLEVGCGSGLLTRYLVDAGHRVIATDASLAMLELARETVPDAEAIERIALPDDPLPEADAVVSISDYTTNQILKRNALPGERIRLIPPSLDPYWETDGVAAQLLAEPINVYRLALHPAGMAPRITNLSQWAYHILDRLQQESLRDPDDRLASLVTELATYAPDRVVTEEQIERVRARYTINSARSF